MDSTAFKDNWGVSQLPAELEKLIEFQNERSGFEEYAQGFGLLIEDHSGISSWSEDPAFLEQILPFAQANGSGSIYAFWKHGAEELSNCPVLVFGDEGGVHVVAENFREFLRLLTYDTEISVDFDEVYFYKEEEDYEASEDHEAYLDWLKENFKLDKEENPDRVIEAAQEKYKPEFDAWFQLYYAD